MKLEAIIAGSSATEPRAHNRKRGRPRRAKLASHPAFVPLIAAWSAMLAGLIVLVLPEAALAPVAAPLDAIGEWARFAIAGSAALIGGAIGLGIARIAAGTAPRAADEDPLTNVASRRRMQPINPAEELGSLSLDAPIETMPLGIDPDNWLNGAQDISEAKETGERGVSDPTATASSGSAAKPAGHTDTTDMDSPDADPEPASRSETPEEPDSPQWLGWSGYEADAALETAPDKASSACGENSDCAPLSEIEPPTELDLAAFAALPGRNAVWVDAPPDRRADPADPSLPSSEELAGGTRARASEAAMGGTGKTAIDRLREVPAEELSLVQMVERFAAALHERQAEASSSDGIVNSDPDNGVLAQALAALSALTDDARDARGPDVPGDTAMDSSAACEGELRAALAKLHNMRGAA